jgi:hypothetical protein
VWIIEGEQVHDVDVVDSQTTFDERYVFYGRGRDCHAVFGEALITPGRAGDLFLDFLFLMSCDV